MIKVNDTLNHPSFGKGKVMSIDGNYVTVEFKDKKRILLKNYIQEHHLSCSQKFHFIFDSEKLIFNYDGTYLDGFEKLFLDAKSRCNLYDNYAVILNGSISDLVKRKKYNISIIGEFKPKKIDNFIEDYMLKNNANKDDIVIFTSSEFNSYFYAYYGINFCVIKKQTGYINYNLSTIFDKTEFNKKSPFFIQYCAEILEKCKDHNCILYFKRQYDKTNGYRSIEALEDGNMIRRKSFLSKFKANMTYDNFGKDKRNLYHSFVHDFDDMIISKDIILVKVPGSKEVVTDNDQLAAQVIKSICIKNKINNDYSDLVLRKKATPSHNASYNQLNRNSLYQISTLVINSKYNLNDIRDKTIYLFDDIVTTGSHMIAVYKFLKKLGFEHIFCFANARTCKYIN